MRNIRKGGVAALVLVLTLAVAALAWAADSPALNGVWRSAGDNGAPPFVFTFKSAGAVLNGTMLDMDGKQDPISNGKLDGDKISFTVGVQYQGQPITLDASGTRGDGQIQLHVGTEDGSWGVDVVLKPAPAGEAGAAAPSAPPAQP